MKKLAELEALATHYPQASRSPDLQRRWLKDYLDAVSAYSDEAVTKACREWKHSEATKFPTIGQLLALVRKATPGRDALEKPEPWREPTDEEYEALPLREKVRHHQIMATNARAFAGPMWSRFRPVHPDDMSDTWHALQAKARRHDEEAARLSEQLRKAKQREVIAPPQKSPFLKDRLRRAEAV